MNLFQTGDFTLHSGARSKWKIECEAFTRADWNALALMLSERLPPFGHVVGVPRGGFPLSTALRPYITTGPTLLVDDVLTTGASMASLRKYYRYPKRAIGAVVFARGPCPDWVTPLFTLSPALTEGSPS